MIQLSPENIYESNSFTEVILRITNPILFEAYKKKKQANPFKEKGGSVPTTDSKGNKWLNIGITTVKDFFHRSRNDAQHLHVIRKYCINDSIILVIDPNNENEILVMTTTGKKLGILPDEGSFTYQIKRRLNENYDIYAMIYNYEILHNGRLSCEIRIAYHETPFDKPEK